MKQYLLPENLYRELVEYLSMRPYREVANAMAALRLLPTAPEPKDEKKAP